MSSDVHLIDQTAALPVDPETAADIEERAARASTFVR
jgi:hypothetical protein